MNLASNTVLKVMRPLYRIAESGPYWCLTYAELYVNNLDTLYFPLDLCFVFQTKHGIISAVVIQQGEDSIFVAAERFPQRLSRWRCRLSLMNFSVLETDKGV